MKKDKKKKEYVPPKIKKQGNLRVITQETSF